MGLFAPLFLPIRDGRASYSECVPVVQPRHDQHREPP